MTQDPLVIAVTRAASVAARAVSRASGRPGCVTHDDLYQQAWLACWTQRCRVDLTDARAPAYLHRIAYRAAADAATDMLSPVRPPPDGVLDRRAKLAALRGGRPVHDDDMLSAGPDADYQQAQAWHTLCTAVGVVCVDVPREQRAWVYRVFVDGDRAADVAADAGVSAGAFDTLVRRVRRQLRAIPAVQQWRVG